MTLVLDPPSSLTGSRTPRRVGPNRPAAANNAPDNAFAPTSDDSGDDTFVIDLLAGEEPDAPVRPRRATPTARVRIMSSTAALTTPTAHPRAQPIAPQRPGTVGGVAASPAVLAETAEAPTRPAGRTSRSGRPGHQRPAVLPDGVVAFSKPRSTRDGSRSAANHPSHSPNGDAPSRLRASTSTLITPRRVVLGAAVGLPIIAVGLVLSPLFSVRSIDVRGLESLASRSVAETAGSTRGKPMVFVRTSAIADSLRRRGDLESVSVARRWPNRLVISATLTRAVAVIRSGGRDQLIDNRGREITSVFVDGDATTLPLITLDGDDAGSVDTIRSDVSHLLGLLDPTLMRRVKSVSRFGDEYVMNLGDVSLQLGRAIDLEAKASALQALQDSGQLDRASWVDLSVPDTAIVTSNRQQSS